MDEAVSFFQVCHATNQHLRKQRQCKIAAKKEHKEANQERDAANKKCTTSRRNNSLSTGNDKPEKLGCSENLCCNCKLDGYDVTWNSCFHHNFWHPTFCQPSSLLVKCSWDKPSCDCDEYCNVHNSHRSWSSSCDRYDHRNHDCKPAACDRTRQTYHAKHHDQSISRTWSQSRPRSCDSQILRHNHGHYIHHDDNRKRRQVRSPVAPPHLSLEWRLSPLKPNHLQFNIKIGLLTCSPWQHPHKVMMPFLSILPQPKYNGYHELLILFLNLLRIPMTGMMARMMMMIMTFLSTT